MWCASGVQVVCKRCASGVHWCASGVQVVFNVVFNLVCNTTSTTTNHTNQQTKSTQTTPAPSDAFHHPHQQSREHPSLPASLLVSSPLSEAATIRHGFRRVGRRGRLGASSLQTEPNRIAKCRRPRWRSERNEGVTVQRRTR